MATRISATRLARSLSDVLSRAAYRGEEFVIERNGQDIARLQPVGPGAAITPCELAERLRGMAMPGDGFADDLEAAQRQQGEVETHAWDS